MIPNTKYQIPDTKRRAMTGAQAAAEALRQINPDVMPVYPITPQTPIIETFAKIQAKKKVDTEIITVESEHSAMSACVGSSAAGARTVTASSSQGLALMNEVLYIASGMRLPILMVVSARALASPLNIHCDHSDVMGARDTGWVQIFCENAQEAYDNTLIGMKLAEAARCPVMVIMDGFITSHSVENLEILTDETVKNFVGDFNPESSLLDAEDPKTFGAMALPDTYMDFKISQGEAVQKSHDQYRKIANEFRKMSGRSHGIVEEYETRDAEHIILVAGSTAGTAKEVVDKLRSDGKRVGALKIKLFRPFPYADIQKIVAKARNAAVMDKSLSFGAYPPLFLDVAASCRQSAISHYLFSYVYGLGGRDIFKKDIEDVFDDLMDGKASKKIKHIGSK